MVIWRGFISQGQIQLQTVAENGIRAAAISTMRHLIFESTKYSSVTTFMLLSEDQCTPKISVSQLVHVQAFFIQLQHFRT